MSPALSPWMGLGHSVFPVECGGLCPLSPALSPGVGLGCSVFPMGMEGHCPPAWCHHLCQDGTRMLSVPNHNRMTMAPVLCHLRPARAGNLIIPIGNGITPLPGPVPPALHHGPGAGTLLIPPGLCPGWCPRSVCNQPRSRVRPGPAPAQPGEKGEREGGRQSRGAQPGERRERGGDTCQPCPALPGGTPPPWGQGDTAPPWPGCSSCCSWRLWAVRAGRAGGRRRGTMERMVIAAPFPLGTPFPLGIPFPPGVWGWGRV